MTTAEARTADNKTDGPQRPTTQNRLQTNDRRSGPSGRQNDVEQRGKTDRRRRNETATANVKTDGRRRTETAPNVMNRQASANQDDPVTTDDGATTEAAAPAADGRAATDGADGADETATNRPGPVKSMKMSSMTCPSDRSTSDRSPNS